MRVKKDGVQENLLLLKEKQLSYAYEILKVIGEGSISSISLIRKNKNGSLHAMKSPYQKLHLWCCKPSADENCDEDSIFALKTINVRNVNNHLMRELYNEINVLRELDHPNIIKAYEVYRMKKSCAIVMEYCSGGDLYSRKPYSEDQASQIMKQLTSAIGYMHDKNITHRDIKFENIMFESTHPNAAVKLIDFGLSKKYMKKTRILVERVGTIYTMAPEVLKGKYTEKADMWSLGVVAYILLTLELPFWGRTRDQIAKRIEKQQVSYSDSSWSHISEEAKSFVKSLLDKNQNTRKSADQARRDPWFHKNMIQYSKNKPDYTQIKNKLKDSWLNYAVTGEIKKLALTVIAHKSAPEKILQLREIFHDIDIENTGFISREEFEKAFPRSDFSKDDLECIFSSLDYGKDGRINYTEFLAASLEMEGRITENSLAEAFDRIDADDSGYISHKNLRDILGKQCDAKCVEKILKEIDYDKDGKVSYDDFTAAFYSNKNEEMTVCYKLDCC